MPSRRNNSGKQPLIVGALLAVVLSGGVSCEKSHRKAPAKEQIITIAPLPPPPPPPPPPKLEPPPPKDEPKEEMVEQQPVPDDEPPPEAAPPEAPSDEALGTNISGNGPDMGLSRGGGNGTRIGGTGRKGGGSRFGWYAAKVQVSIAEALRRNPATKSASMSLQVRVWPDPNGRIARVQLIGTSGNSTVDQAIRDQVLTGLQLPQAPPADMPLPIVLRITARKPGS